MRAAPDNAGGAALPGLDKGAVEHAAKVAGVLVVGGLRRLMIRRYGLGDDLFPSGMKTKVDIRK